MNTGNDINVDFELDFRMLKAVSIASSYDVKRPYLNCVNFEAKNNVLIMTATDGHKLITAKYGIDSEEENNLSTSILCENTRKDFMCNIPIKFLDSIKLIPRKYICYVIIRDNVITLNYNGIDYMSKLLEGSKEFPDWRLCIPRFVEPKIAQFDPKLLCEFVKVAKILELGHPILHHNGANANIIIFPNRYDILGVLMPIRISEQDEEFQPENFSWAYKQY